MYRKTLPQQKSGRTPGDVRGEIACLRERAQSPLLAYEQSDLKSKTRAGNFTLSQSVLSGAIQSQIEAHSYQENGALLPPAVTLPSHGLKIASPTAPECGLVHQHRNFEDLHDWPIAIPIGERPPLGWILRGSPVSGKLPCFCHT